MNLLTLLQAPGVLVDAAKSAKSAIPTEHEAYIIAIIGLAGTLVPVILSWTKDVGLNAQRSKQLDEGVQRITFWEQWLRVSTLVGDDTADLARQRVKQELDLLCSAFSTSSALIHSEATALKALKVQFKSKLAGTSYVRRLLLLYKPPRPLAWVPRFFFYLFGLVTSIEILFELIVALDRTVTSKGSLMGGFLLFIIFTTLAALAFRFLSIMIETPHKTMTEINADLTAAEAPPI